MKRTLVILLGLAVLAVAANAPAAIITIDFNDLEQAGTGFRPVADPYTEDGFKVSDTQGGAALYLASPQTNNTSWYAGSPALFEMKSGGQLELRRMDGGRFSVLSIDLSFLTSGTGSRSADVEFTGDLIGGGTTTEEFTVSAFGFNTFEFNPSFRDVVKVSWQQSVASLDYVHQFDNIVVQPVPEPSTVVIWSLLGALGLTVGWYRRRKNA